MPDPQVPHLRVPIRFEAGRAALVEQDTQEEIEQCVEAIIRYPLGYRLDQPDFGVADPAFSQAPVGTEDLEAAIMTWEPRADALLEENPDSLDSLVDRIRVAVR